MNSTYKNVRSWLRIFGGIKNWPEFKISFNWAFGWSWWKILQDEHDNIISLILSRCACKVKDLLRNHLIPSSLKCFLKILLSWLEHWARFEVIQLIEQLIAAVDPNWPLYLKLIYFLKSGFWPNLITLDRIGSKITHHGMTEPDQITVFVQIGLVWPFKNVFIRQVLDKSPEESFGRTNNQLSILELGPERIIDLYDQSCQSVTIFTALKKSRSNCGFHEKSFEYSSSEILAF